MDRHYILCLHIHIHVYVYWIYLYTYINSIYNLQEIKHAKLNITLLGFSILL